MVPLSWLCKAEFGLISTRAFTIFFWLDVESDWGLGLYPCPISIRQYTHKCIIKRPEVGKWTTVKTDRVVQTHKHLFFSLGLHKPLLVLEYMTVDYWIH